MALNTRTIKLVRYQHLKKGGSPYQWRLRQGVLGQHHRNEDQEQLPLLRLHGLRCLQADCASGHEKLMSSSLTTSARMENRVLVITYPSSTPVPSLSCLHLLIVAVSLPLRVSLCRCLFSLSVPHRLYRPYVVRPAAVTPRILAVVVAVAADKVLAELAPVAARDVWQL